MNLIKNKLKSERGASISWALLIFLVCAVVGSAVLVAGTTASGRFSKLAENDQRYYAVTSSAGLLRDILKQPITVTRTASDSTAYATYTIAYKDGADELEKAVVRSMMGWPDTPKNSDSPITDPDVLWNKDAVSPVSTVKMTMDGGEGLTDSMGEISGALTIGADGSIVAEIEKGTNNRFKMRLTFEMNRTAETAPQANGTIIKTDKFSWTLKEAQKIGYETDE